MHVVKRVLIILAPVLVLGACQGLSDEDRALLTSTNQNAEQAKQMAQQALDASRAAQASASPAPNHARAAKHTPDRISPRARGM